MALVIAAGMGLEALVKAPELELRRICDFLAVPYDDGMLRYPAHSTYGAPDARMAERWRENLTTRELALLERELGDELRGRGYPPSEVAPARISALQRLALRAGAKLGVLRFRARRYGFFLWLRHHLALRLHLRALRRDSLLRMQAIDVAHLK